MEKNSTGFRKGRRLFILILLTIVFCFLWYWLTSVEAFDEYWDDVAFVFGIMDIFFFSYWIPKMKAEGKLIVKK